MLDEVNTLEALRARLSELPQPDRLAREGAVERNSQLTKPPGALGRLEELAKWYAGWRGDARPRVKAPQVVIFAGNHGVTAQGVSAFPAEVTEQMVVNFVNGGAAINQLSRAAGARMDVFSLSLDQPTVDFTTGPAMSEPEFLAAFATGWDSVDSGSDLLVAGEMGIGNTTSAAALALSLFGGVAADWVGRGTGVDEAGLALKAEVVTRGVALHGSPKGLEALRVLGGRELVAMVGAIARARILRIPVVLDGFICCAAAACLADEFYGALDHCVAGHVSAEAAHGAVLARLGKQPLLSLGMRLGEGSGGALAIGIVKAAVECHSGMATFAEAGVSDG